MIPKELQVLKQWTYSFSEEEKKRPTHYHYEPDGALSMAEAVEMAGENKFIGFYVTPEDPYLLGDCDHVENPNDPFSELPVPLAALLQSKNTYSEISPSGSGIRFILQLPRKEDKQEAAGENFGAINFDGQINFGKPWQTITLHPTAFSVDEIAEVTLDELRKCFNIRNVTDQQPRVVGKIPEFDDIRNNLMHIPVDGDSRVRRAYKELFEEEYETYGFWIKVLQALHDYATLADKMRDGLELAIEWSRTGELFTSEDRVIVHWRSFSEKPNPVSFLTLFKLSRVTHIEWPQPKKQSGAEYKAGLPLQPMISEYVNFKALVDYFGIEFHRDERNPNLLYLSGDEDAIKEHFDVYEVTAHYEKYYGPFTSKTLTPAFHILCQSVGFTGIGHKRIDEFMKNALARSKSTINLVKLFFDTPYDELPPKYREENYDTTSFDKLFSCLTIDFSTGNKPREEELYKAYYRKWLMGILRNLYYSTSPQMNNCVLLLTGPEQIRKTSHFRFMLPEFMRDKIAFTTHGFDSESSMRDVVKLSATNLIIVWDELEQFLQANTESNFKKIIDGNPQKIIDKYEVVEKTIYPMAVYGATSNMREFKLGDEGSRRIFHIPVKWVDTNKMAEICWWKLFDDLRRDADWEIKNAIVPWLLTQDQLNYQRSLHSLLRAKTGLDLTLDQIFDFDQKMDLTGGVLIGIPSIQKTTKRAMNLKQVSDTIAQHGYSTLNINNVVLKKTLERMCGEYTNTRTVKREVQQPRCVVFKGLAEQGGHKKFIMPELRMNQFAS